MERIAILTDSIAGLPDEVVREYNITVIPLHVHFGTESYLDSDMSPEEFYRRMREDKNLPTTSSPSMGEIESFYRRLADEGARTIIYIPYGGELGMEYGVAQSAAQDVPGLDIRIVNPHTALMAQGFVVLEAARAVRAGASPEEALGRVEALIPRAISSSLWIRWNTCGVRGGLAGHRR